MKTLHTLALSLLNQAQLALLRTIAIGCVSLLAAASNAGPGALDPTFAPTVNGAVYATAVQPDGGILLGGAFAAVNGSSSRYHLARLFDNGSLDSTFFTNGSGVSSTVWCLAVQTDGRIVIGGDFASVNGTARTRVARLNVNGTVDGSFVPTNSITSSVLAVAVQSDNKVIIGGSFYGYAPAYNARLNADGTLDTAFSSYPNNTVDAIGIQSDGKIVIGGAFTQVNGASRYRIARLNADGSLDNAFQNGLSGASSTVRCLQIQTDGKILIGGDFTGVNNTSRNYVARLNSDGSLDTGFISYPGANGSVYALAEQPDSSVVIGGSFTSYASYSLSHVARLYPDGTRDTSFSTSGINNLVEALAVQSDGGLLIGGTFTTINNSNYLYFGRLYGDLYPPEFISQPVSRNTNVGASVTFTVLVDNPTPSYYQWRKEGLDIPGATDMSYLLSNVQLGDAGSYSVFVNNAVGGVTSSNAVLNVGIAPAITGQPVSLVVTQGQTATFTVTATGTPLNYFWKKGGAFITGATNSAYTIASVVAASAATYTCQVSNFLGNVTSAGATLTVYSPPAITVQPVSQTIGISSNFTVSVTATGNPALAYQWSKDSTNLLGATAYSYTVTNAQTNDAGGYSVVVSNLLGSVTSSVASITLLYYAPSIVVQPAGQAVLVSSNFTLTVTASGSAPMAYQWRKDGADLPGQSATSYSVTGAQTNDSGGYTVVVTNLSGGVTSTVAYVNVGYAPLIVQQPQPFTNNLGESNAFSVLVFGSEPFLYQWFKDDIAIANATNNLLPLSNLQSNQVGYYSVTVTNLYGWTTSSNALLSIPGVPLPFQWLGLVAYYPFNANANDATGNGNNGTNYGAAIAPDRFGNANSAYAFDGASSYIDFGSPSDLAFASNFTLTAWCLFSGGADNPRILSYGQDIGYELLTVGTGTSRSFQLDCGSQYFDTPVNYTQNVWYSVVAVVQNGTGYIYVSGVLVASSPVSTPSYPYDFQIGENAQNNTDYWGGSIDEVRLYNRALSSDEVAQLYAYEADIPVITSQPQGSIVSQGSTVSFGVVATAQNPLTYQWSEDGVPISTNATLFIPNVQPAQAGLYTVAISNGFTGVVSAPAALAVMSSSGAGAPGFTGNQFGFGINGPAASTFVVEASTNLQTWLPLSTNTFGVGLFQFVDPASVTNPIRFYRTHY
ncbi:MAG: immunoglobulin domain-containing protein [Verrucomicrobiota bacterium]|jgi:uncharacterized delta-60 repeat protein